MASTYAHHRLGKQLLPALPGDVKQCITRFRRMYDMGLQGPDFFFYHNPFMKTKAGELGYRFHGQSGKVFFEQACKAANSEAARAYLYGLLAHYCLDSVSHPFIKEKEKSGEGRHAPMEKEFDRYLMAMDGLESPHTQDLGKMIRLTRGECVTVAAFYPPATPNQVNQSVKFMAVSLSFLAKKKRSFLGKILLSPGLLENAIPEEADKNAQLINSELLARFNWCLRDYPRLLEQLENHRKTGTELGEEFAPAFG